MSLRNNRLRSIIIVAASGLILTACGSEPEVTQPSRQAVTVTASPPVVRAITEWDEYTGRFAAVEHVDVRARVSGYLKEITFEDGEFVEKGDLLFQIDSRPFRAELNAAEAERQSAEAALANARAENERGQRLFERQAISEEEVQDRTRALREAEAMIAAASARVERARLDLEFSEIRASISGRISDNFVSVGNLVTGGAVGGTVLTRIVSLDPIYLEFTGSEADYIKYMRLSASGDRPSSRDAANPVQLRLLDEEDFEHQGQMSFVDNQLDPSTGTIRGRATFDNPNGAFAPGMFARIRLLGSNEYEAVLIPDAAVQTDQSQKFVWVVDDENNAARQDVILGPMAEGLRIVREGLSGDDVLITSGVQFIQPGTPVTVQSSNES